MSALGKIPVAHPDWLQQAIKDEVQKLRLIGNGTVPDVLVGRFVVVGCRRLLRCVYGSDLEVAAALRQMVIDQEQEELNRCHACDRLLVAQSDAGIFDGPLPKCAKHAEAVNS